MATKKQWYVVSMSYDTDCGYEIAEKTLQFTREGLHVEGLSCKELELNYWFEASTQEEAGVEAVRIASKYGINVFTVYKAERAFTEEDIAE